MFRWIALAVFAAAIGISARQRSKARQASGAIPRSAEPPGLVVGRLVVALPLFGGVVAYLANPAWMAWASMGLPTWIRWTGVALGLLVIPSVYWVLSTLGENVSETVLTKPAHRLVTTGPYRWVRHPLYTVGTALFVSMGLMAANWFILLWAGVAAIALRLVVVPREEARLVAVFGDAYTHYRRQTGALLPLLRRTRERRDDHDTPQDGRREMTRMFVRNSAYGFSSGLTLDQIYDTLTATLPWKWHRRENHAYGDYLWASTDIERSALRLIEEDGRYVLDVEFHSDQPEAEAACDLLHRRVRDELLPAIGAADVRPAPHHGR